MIDTETSYPPSAPKQLKSSSAQPTTFTQEAPQDRRRWLTPVLSILLVLLVAIALFQGAYALTIRETLMTLLSAIGWADGEVAPSVQYLLVHIRLPRILLGVVVGAGLSVSGAAIQGLFRNPLADPTLIGITSGGMLFAIMGIVLANTLLAGVGVIFGYATVSVLAIMGSLLTTLLVYRLATYQGRTQITTMLLAGIAITALCGAITGLFTYFSSEAQLRDITFWTLGSLAGANWSLLAIIFLPIVVAIVLLLRHSRSLDLFLLGEQEAAYLGVPVQRVKGMIIILTALTVGVCVSVTGIISFVALIVPHWVRLLIGPTHKALLINSALLGASLLVLADMIARTVIAPAELPIGILTALLGAPFFIWMLLKDRMRTG